MKGLVICLLLLMLGGCAQRYEVLRVVDGDTFVVEDSSGIRTRIRLRNVDAPEKGEPGYEEAKAALEQRIRGKRIRLKTYAIDAYGRTVAELNP